ncbi:MAG: sialate O-acetylesterase [Kiritimatiellia bacterium]
MDPAKGKATEPPPWLDKNGKPIDWYAGKQWDDDTADARRALAELDKHYPGATKYEVAGFFFWQGEKDCGNAAHAAKYEENLVKFIKMLRKEFNAPNARFVLATLGEAEKGATGSSRRVLAAHLAVDGNSGKYRVQGQRRDRLFPSHGAGRQRRRPLQRQRRGVHGCRRSHERNHGRTAPPVPRPNKRRAIYGLFCDFKAWISPAMEVAAAGIFFTEDREGGGRGAV